MSTETKHTPPPWKLNEKEKHPWLIEAPSNIPGIPATIVKIGYRPNAAFIVRAVNSHAKLVEACKLALDSFGGLQPERYMKASRAQFDALTEALSLAQGGER